MSLLRLPSRGILIRFLICHFFAFQVSIFFGAVDPSSNFSVHVSRDVSGNRIIERNTLTTDFQNGSKAVCGVMNHSASADIWQPYQYLGNCHWRLLRVTGYSINFYEDLIPEDSSSPEIVCPFTVRRLYTTLSGEVDFLSPEGNYTYLSALQSTTAPASVSWCGDRKKWINHMVCGRSFIGFRKRVDISKPNVLEMQYPLMTSVTLIIDSHRRLFDDCYLGYQLNFNGSMGLPLDCGTTDSLTLKPATKLNTARNQVTFRIFGQTLKQANMMKTASHMGFTTTWRPEAEFHSVECSTVVSELTFFFGHRQMTWLLGVNIGHLIHDNLYRVFSTIHSYVNLLQDSEDRNEYLVIAADGDWKQGWYQGFEKSWGIGPLGHLMEALMPRRPALQIGMCFKKAVFDCPMSNTMVPMEYLQKWLERNYRMSFSPLPRIRDEKKLLLLMVRNKNSSRSIDNAQEMSATAVNAGWNVSIPLSSDNSSIYHKMLDLLPLFQKCSLLVGLHGSELAPMIFMPRYSVVVEIIPIHFKYVDAWYLHQANASTLHLLRWSPVNSSIEYGPRMNSYTEKKYYKVQELNRTEEEGARRMRSTFRAPIEEWSQILNFSDVILHNDDLKETSSFVESHSRKKKRVSKKIVSQINGRFSQVKDRLRR
eukprot:TRINITY_DN36839_c0_g1_i1.p1 TRINITY_DN36839_c0_g1~~TRINITY_DN36839_c0_g1_i1.p1  ORF type:complete len:650 (+),score=43.87 TRINITY_DN36839_c0_g1_i1:92-2041(+)